MHKKGDLVAWRGRSNLIKYNLCAGSLGIVLDIHKGKNGCVLSLGVLFFGTEETLKVFSGEIEKASNV